MASALNHKHMVIHNNRVLSEEEWRAIGNKRGEGEKGDIPIDAAFVASVVERVLDNTEAGVRSPLD